MSELAYINTFVLDVTGTNFGTLSGYPKASFRNAYLFTDVFGNANYSLPLTTYGGNFYEKYTDTEISDLSGLQVWLDASDSNYVSLSTNNRITRLLRLLDKSGKGNFYDRLETKNAITTAYWPVDKDFKIQSQEYIDSNYIYLSSGNKCINFLTSNFLYCSSLKVDVYSPFSIYIVWKNNYIVNPDDLIKEKTIPFSFVTDVSGVSSELVSYISTNSDPNLIIGSRDSLYGFKINTLSAYNASLSLPNIFEFVYDGSFVNSVTSQAVFYNGTTKLSSDDFYNVPDIFQKYYTTTIGYSGDGNTNNFYFGEMLCFNRVLSAEEREKLLNTLFSKWNLSNTYENTEFKFGILSGGPLKNLTYEDFSLLVSEYSVPVQSCVTLLTLSLSSFDESVSKIKKIIYDYNGEVGNLNTIVYNTLQNNVNSLSELNDRTINLILKPSDSKFFDTFNVSISVVKYDGTLNKIKILGNITQCSIKDLHRNNYMVDSQIIDNLYNEVVVVENKNNKQVFLTKINTDTTLIYTSGGDLVELQPDSDIGVKEDIITLAEILEQELTSKPVYKVPFIRPPVLREINPIRPT